jgi:hypothetical protein
MLPPPSPSLTHKNSPSGLSPTHTSPPIHHVSSSSSSSPSQSPSPSLQQSIFNQNNAYSSNYIFVNI